MTTSPPLNTHNHSVAPSGKIKIIFPTPYLPQVFLAQLTITPDTAVTSITGTVTPGKSPTQGGLCTVVVGKAEYDLIAQYLLKDDDVAISYVDATKVVTGLIWSSHQATALERGAPAEANASIMP